MTKKIIQFIAKFPSRLDRAIQKKLNTSRNQVIHLIKSSNTSVGKRIVTKAGYPVRVGDKIKISFPISQSLSLKPLKADLDIIFENDNFLVINKPPFLPVHPSPGHPDDTLVNILAHHYPDFKNFDPINQTLRPGIVHRLDINTSGLIIIAKNQPTLNRFQQDIKEKKWQKIYLAWVLNNSQRGFRRRPGSGEAGWGTIKKNLIRHPRHRKTFTITTPDCGKTAITHYQIIDNIKYDQNTLSLLKIKLETGRTHQIRVHMLSENMPIIGDNLYHNKDSRLVSKKLDIKRQLLHATELIIIDPVTDQPIHFVAPLPDDFNIKNGIIE